MTQLDPDSADLSLLQDRQVAVLGYDEVGAAHALNLRDSGVEVRIGADPDSAGAVRAEMDGLMVMAPADAVAACDIVLVPSGSGAAADVAQVQELLRTATEPGDMLVLTSSGPLQDGALAVPDSLDVVMIKAVGDAARIREEYLDGRGCPALVAVHHDRSGAAWATLTAYAAALGSLRSGAVVTTVEHEAQAQRYAERHLRGPLRQVLEQGFQTLVSRGVEEEVAYLALLHDLKATVDDLTVSGFVQEDVEGGTDPHPLERTGRRVRSMMSWIR